MSTTERVYYPGLDALRGIAILLVVVYHYFYFFRIGWIGVDLFFVLSGFLITTILLKDRHKKNYFRNFYVRRVLRIFPLYYFVLFVFYSAAPFVFSEKGPQSAYDYYTQNVAWFLTYTQNWLIITKGRPPEPYLIHFWSLAVEEQFYLVWPFLLYVIRSPRALKMVVTSLFLFALGLRLYLWFSSAPNEAYYYNSLARMDSLAAGAFLAICIAEKQVLPTIFFWLSGALFLVTLLFAFVVFKSLDHNSAAFATVGYSISAVFFMFICYRTILHPSMLTENHALKYIGRISYGIYVYHLPVYLVVSAVLTKAKHFSGAPSTSIGVAVSFLCIGITLAASAVSYKLLELPLLRLRHNFI